MNPSYTLVLLVLRFTPLLSLSAWESLLVGYLPSAAVVAGTGLCFPQYFLLSTAFANVYTEFVYTANDFSAFRKMLENEVLTTQIYLDNQAGIEITNTRLLDATTYTPVNFLPDRIPAESSADIILQGQITQGYQCLEFGIQSSANVPTNMIYLCFYRKQSNNLRGEAIPDPFWFSVTTTLPTLDRTNWNHGPLPSSKIIDITDTIKAQWYYDDETGDNPNAILRIRFYKPFLPQSTIYCTLHDDDGTALQDLFGSLSVSKDLYWTIIHKGDTLYTIQYGDENSGLYLTSSSLTEDVTLLSNPLGIYSFWEFSAPPTTGKVRIHSFEGRALFRDIGPSGSNTLKVRSLSVIDLASKLESDFFDFEVIDPKNWDIST